MDPRADDLVDRDLDYGEGRIEAATSGWEAAEADAADQRQGVRENRVAWSARATPFDVDPADAADQDRMVELDEDDYR